VPDDQAPRRITPRIKAAPKIRQVYWCDFWQDAMLPEMWKRRPVIVISYKNALFGPCLVIPLSTQPQDENPWAHRLSVQFDGKPTWAVCNHPYTVSPSRLSTSDGRIPVVPERDFNAVLASLHKWLPKPFLIEN
jgi:mRNA interferase MazF